MTRVSENSNKASVNFAISRAKSRLEELQLKGANLKKVRRPSDNPIGNVTALELTSNTNTNKQYLKNIDYAQLNLATLERSLEEITNVLVKAKEISIAQSSDFYDGSIRENVAQEIKQLKNQVIGISNQKLGNRFIFSGHKSSTKPFSESGQYFGDDNDIKIEVNKNYFIPITMSGDRVFFPGKKDTTAPQKTPPSNQRLPASTTNLITEEKDQTNRVENTRKNIIHHLNSLENALKLNDKELVQSLLDKFDQSIDHIVKLRTRVGSITSNIDSIKLKLEKENIDNASHKSKLIDADVAELFSDIAKHQQILDTTYRSSQAILNQSLMNFIK